MSNEVLQRRFATIGARVKVENALAGAAPRIDVRVDRRGEYFELRFDGARGAEAEVVDVRPDDRHLLLLLRADGDKSKFLCGHDERHWFVAAVPEEARGVTGVATAMAALQPEEVRSAATRLRRPQDRLRRRNGAYVRQGEWFFVPEPGLGVHEALVLRDEPLSRGRGTPHVLELAYRRGGQLVYVNHRNPGGITEAQFGRLTREQQRRGGWSRMVRDPELFARGAIRHPDHATIVLREWHRVLMNTEQQASAMRLVAFLD
jgi:hypothetical protein